MCHSLAEGLCKVLGCLVYHSLAEGLCNVLGCFVFFCAVLREEDYPDKPNEFIESCIGMSEPVAKVCQLLSLLAS